MSGRNTETPNQVMSSVTLTINHCVVLCTCPSGDASEALARALVGEKLAACVNLLPSVRSIYRWNGAVETAEESLLVIKTTMEHYAALEARIRALHPYEIPEIIALPIAAGLPQYLHWLTQPDSTP